MRKVLPIVIFLLLGGLATAQSSQLQPYILLVPEIINVYPHDGNAFTQGLLWHEGKLYESTGQRGESSLREVILETGEVVRQVDVSRPASETAWFSTNRNVDYFAEGLTLVDNQLIQLTWTEGEAFVYDLDTFEKTNTFSYEGEGWGICYDGRYLYMSDGTSFIDLRDPNTFEAIVSFAPIATSFDPNTGATQSGIIKSNWLNELECVGDSIYANLWRTNWIAQIDKVNSNVIAIIDCTGLLTEEEIAAVRLRSSDPSLNGIAYNPDTETFYLTGKNWDKLFEVRFVERASG